jgi:hypothetical protein
VAAHQVKIVEDAQTEEGQVRTRTHIEKNRE